VTLLLRVHGNSEVELAALRRRRALDDRLAGLVQAAADEGALRDDIPPDLISRLLFGMVNSLVEWYRPDGKVDPSYSSARSRTWRSRGWGLGAEAAVSPRYADEPALPTTSTSWRARVHRGRRTERSDLS
jgi:hypothetical protein